MYTQNYPEDSVLRRHYEQLKNAEIDAPPQPGKSWREPDTSASSSDTAAGSGQSGLMAWLRRLFGG